MQSFFQSHQRSGCVALLAALMTFGNVPGVPSVVSAQTTEVRKTSPIRLEEPAFDRLPAALLKRVPESVADLRQIEDHVQSLVDRITACTVSLRVGPAQGSGVLVSADGHVLTAAHVSGPPGRRIMVTLPDGTETIGQTLGRNSTLDASLVRIGAANQTWPYAKMADIGEVQQGDWCLVTGHPGGYQAGRPPVVRLGRVIVVTNRLIQTDCELVGGDSGGPVFDMRGHVIGINSRIGEDTSFNLHVPVNVYTDNWDRLMASESFHVHSGAFLGVQGEPVEGGVKLTKVWSEQPAARAGIQEGDILLRFQEVEVRTMGQLKDLVGEEPPGRRVRLSVQRDNEVLEMTVRLGSQLEDDQSPERIRPLPNSYLTNGAATRRVFPDVVSDANQWTVRVLAAGEEVAFGMIVRADGYILTKGSRLEGALECELPGNRVLPAQYVGYHGEHDLALLKVDAAGLPVVRWQEGEDPAVGRWAVTPDAQGSPRAVGIISVSRREVPKVKVRGVLGVELDPQHQPAKILGIIPESAAERAGLQPGDLISRVNQVTVASSGTFITEIGKHHPHEMVRLLVTRDGKHQIVEVTLTHPFGRFLSRIAAQNEMGGKLSLRRTGFPVVLQHDSVLRPEECGGPLIDLSGAAIGINIARAGRTETYAIPDDIVRPLIDELLSGKYPPPRVKLAGVEANANPKSTERREGASGGE